MNATYAVELCVKQIPRSFNPPSLTVPSGGQFPRSRQTTSRLVQSTRLTVSCFHETFRMIFPVLGSIK